MEIATIYELNRIKWCENNIDLNMEEI